MNATEFDQILNDRLEKIKATLSSKAKEYASDSDRLHNFKAAGAMLKCNPAKALQGFLAKHLVSINDMIDESNEIARKHDFVPVKGLNIPQWEEKLGDAINYLILLEAIVKET